MMRAMLPLRREELTLRAMAPDDAAFVHGSRNHPDNIRYQGWRPRTVAEVVEHARRQDPDAIARTPGTIQLVIEADGARVGDFGVTTVRPLPTVSLGITLIPEAHGRGLATRASRLLLDGLFELGVHRVTAEVDPRNGPSLRLFDRLGFRREGHTVAAYRDDLYDEWTDEILFALLAREWPADA